MATENGNAPTQASGSDTGVTINPPSPPESTPVDSGEGQNPVNEFSNDQNTDTVDIMSVFKHDPFAAPVVDEPAQPQSDPVVDPQQQATPDVQPGTQQQPEGAQQQADPAQTEIATLRAQLGQMQQYLAQMVQGQQAQQQGQQQQPQNQELQIPEFEFTIPSEIQNKLDSESASERAEGLQRYGQMVMQAAYRQFMPIIGGAMEQQGNYLTQSVQQAIQTTNQQREIFNDFYNANQDLNRPELYPVVVQVAQQVIQQKGAQGWSSNIRDEIASNVRRVLGMVQRPNGQQPQGPAPTQQQYPAPGNPSRGSGGAHQNGQGSQNDILDVLGF